VLLIAAVVGAKLEELLDACTIMGTEALVEVHTPSELEYALNCHATTFLVNMWDRFTGKLYPNQVRFSSSFTVCANWKASHSESPRTHSSSLFCLCFTCTQAKALIGMMPMNSVAIAAGNIASMRQIYDLGNYGYDGIVLGRNIAEVSSFVALLLFSTRLVYLRPVGGLQPCSDVARNDTCIG